MKTEKSLKGQLSSVTETDTNAFPLARIHLFESWIHLLTSFWLYNLQRTNSLELKVEMSSNVKVDRVSANLHERASINNYDGTSGDLKHQIIQQRCDENQLVSPPSSPLVSVTKALSKRLFQNTSNRQPTHSITEEEPQDHRYSSSYMLDDSASNARHAISSGDEDQSEMSLEEFLSQKVSTSPSSLGVNDVESANNSHQQFHDSRKRISKDLKKIFTSHLSLIKQYDNEPSPRGKERTFSEESIPWEHSREEDQKELPEKITKLLKAVLNRRDRNLIIQELLSLKGNFLVKVRFICAIQECFQETNLKTQEMKKRNIFETFLEGNNTLFHLNFDNLVAISPKTSPTCGR